MAVDCFCLNVEMRETAPKLAFWGGFWVIACVEIEDRRGLKSRGFQREGVETGLVLRCGTWCVHHLTF